MPRRLAVELAVKPQRPAAPDPEDRILLSKKVRPIFGCADETRAAFLAAEDGGALREPEPHEDYEYKTRWGLRYPDRMWDTPAGPCAVFFTDAGSVLITVDVRASEEAVALRVLRERGWTVTPPPGRR